jgi:hypothetical protein
MNGKLSYRQMTNYILLLTLRFLHSFMRPSFFLIPVLLGLGSCEVAKNDNGVWHYPKYIQWPEKRTLSQTSGTSQQDTYIVRQYENGDLDIPEPPGNDVGIAKNDSGALKARAAEDYQKNELAKIELMRWIESTRRFKKLSPEKQDTILEAIKNIRPGDVYKPYESPQTQSNRRFDRLAIASVVLACLGLPFFLPFSLTGIIMGARILQFRDRLQTRREAVASIVLGTVGLAGFIAFVLTLIFLSLFV